MNVDHTIHTPVWPPPLDPAVITALMQSFNITATDAANHLRMIYSAYPPLMSVTLANQRYNLFTKHDRPGFLSSRVPTDSIRQEP